MNFKYQDYIGKLSEQCPPSSYKPTNIKSYRFVFQEGHPNARNNFCPVLIIKPKRKITVDIAKCQAYALSLFNSGQNAKERYFELKKSHPNIRKSLGTHLAEGQIAETDGLASEPDKKGHFSLHEFESTDLSKKFSIIDSFLNTQADT